MQGNIGERGKGIAILDPRFLAALAVLLLNDHWAKAAFPGLITGKLSDVAGMIVLPVLLGTALATVSRTTRTAIRSRIAIAALVVSALFMIVIKTSATGAGLVVDVLEAATAQHQQIIVDPYDLVGLLALPLSFRVLVAPIGIRWEAAVRPLRWGVTVIALVACMASGAAEPTSWPDLEVREDGSILALLDGHHYRGDRISLDDGLTWSSLDEEHPAYVDLLDVEFTRSFDLDQGPVCLTETPTTCVRINQGADIEESLDGGDSWQPVANWDYSEWWVNGIDSHWEIRDFPHEVVATPADSFLVSWGGHMTPLRKDPNGNWSISQADIQPFLIVWLLAASLIQLYAFQFIRWTRAEAKGSLVYLGLTGSIAFSGYVLHGYPPTGFGVLVFYAIGLVVLFIVVSIGSSASRNNGINLAGTPLFTLGSVVVERGIASMVGIIGTNVLAFSLFDKALISWEVGQALITLTTLAAIFVGFALPLHQYEQVKPQGRGRTIAGRATLAANPGTPPPPGRRKEASS